MLIFVKIDINDLNKLTPEERRQWGRNVVKAAEDDFHKRHPGAELVGMIRAGEKYTPEYAAMLIAAYKQGLPEVMVEDGSSVKYIPREEMIRRVKENTMGYEDHEG